MKKTLRRVVVSLLCVLLLATSVLTAFAATTFTDVKDGDWYYEFVTYMSDKGIINGYTDNTFRPNDFVKRSEFIKMMVETFGLELATTINYTDVKSGDWYYDYYRKAAAQGFLTDVFSGTSMKPGDYLTREEAAALLMAYMAYPTADKAATSYFADFNTISTKYRDYVLQAVYAGIIDGFQDGNVKNFRPDESLRRAQAAKILSVAAGTIADKAVNGSLDFDDSDNMVVTDAVSIRNVEIPGNVIISEGVTEGTVNFVNCTIDGVVYNRSTADVVFSGCEIEKLEIDAASAKVDLKQNTEIDELNVNALGATVTFYTGSYVDKATVLAGATGVKILDESGNCGIKTLDVNANNLTCQIEPLDCKVGSGVSATVGNTVYSGGFKGEVRNIWSAGEEYLLFETYIKGTVRYYYTATSTAPTSSNFTSRYNSATYSGQIAADKDESARVKVKGSSASMETYPYIVVSLVEGDTIGKPVVIDRSAARTGFSVDPTLSVVSGKDQLKLAVISRGTVYYYYTNDSVAPESYAVARVLYNGVSTDLKGTLSISTTSTTNQYTKDTTALEGYTYCVVFFVDSDGGEYTPVVIERPTMTDGFKVAPVVEVSDKADGKDVLKFTPSVKATVKWFYTNSTANFSSAYFNTAYAAAATGTKGERASSYITANAENTIEMMKKSDCTYSYVVVMLVESNGTTHIPVKVARMSTSTGFTTDPQVLKTNDNDVITFKTAEAGTVKYIYMSSNVTYTTSSFNTAYENATALHTSEDVTASTTYLVANSVNSNNAKYVALMFVDTRGNNYKPVTVERTDGGTGFKSVPEIYRYTTSADKASELTVNALTAVTIKCFATDNKASFPYEYFDTLGGRSIQTIDLNAGEQTIVDQLSFNYIDENGVPDGPKKYIAMMAMVEGNCFDPIIVDVQEVSYGIESVHVGREGNEDKVTVRSSAAGTFRYYYSNSVPKTVAEFDSAYRVSQFKGEHSVGTTDVSFPTYLSGSVAGYKYLVYRLISTGTKVYTPGAWEIPESHRVNARFSISADNKLSVTSDLKTYTVYWFYSTTEITDITPSNFSTKYNAGLGRGSVNITDYSKSDVTTVKTQATNPTYKYLYAAIKDSAGYYVPVVFDTPSGEE